MTAPVSPPVSLALQDVRVLSITPAPTHPTSAGNRARHRALLERLQARGATVRVLHVLHEPGDLAEMQANWSGGARQIPFEYPQPRHARWNRFAQRCGKYLGLPLAERIDVDDWYDPSLSSAIQAEVEAFRPQAIVMMYFWFSAALPALPRMILRILDAQDVFTDRNARMRASGIEQRWYSVPSHQEARGLDRFDVVLAIQEHEKEHYSSLSRVPVVTVGHFLPVIDCGPPSRQASLLIIGSDNDVNVHGVTWFLTEVFPEIRANCPDAALHLVGRICDRIPPAPGVHRHGVVTDLAALYASAAMVINPLQGGTGLKIKGAEALGAGRVVISTPAAALGLEAAVASGIVVCDSAQAMQRAILDLLGDFAELQRLSIMANAFAVSWNDRYERQFDEIFARVRTPYGDDVAALTAVDAARGSRVSRIQTASSTTGS